MNEAIVFDCHYNGLSIIRELGRHGVRVTALDSRPSIGRFSRYGKALLCPDPSICEEEFVEYLLALAPRFDERPVLFPTNDHWAAAISRYKQALSVDYIPCVADWPAVTLAIHKQRFYDWAHSRGYPVPRSWRASDHRSISDFEFPLVAKPEYRRISGNDKSSPRRTGMLDSLRLTVLRDRPSLERFVFRHRDVLDWMILQKYVNGISDSMYTIGVYANSAHSVTALFTGRKLRGFPPGSGDCVLGQSERLPHELKNMARDLCREIGYQGIAELEFKRDATTGEFWLIEVNPRSWSWVGITPYCGVSLPWIAYSDLTARASGSYVESSAPTGSVKYVKVVEDFLNCAHENRRAGFPEWSLSLSAWWRSLRADRLVLAEFAWDDPIPGIYAVFKALRPIGAGLLKKLWKRRTKMQRAATAEPAPVAAGDVAEESTPRTASFG